MDFRGIVEDTAEQVQTLVEEILAMNISPDAKIEQLSAVFANIGAEFARKTFDDVSYVFDSAAIHSVIEIDIDNQIRGLAIKIVRDSAFEIDDDAIVKEYFDVLLGRSQYQAFLNARSLEKVPTLTRTMTGRETCDWCRARAGTFTYPDPELFQRHDNCDCIFRVSGYNSRNGVLKNYKKARSK